MAVSDNPRGRTPITASAACLLSLAAAPSFAIMALLTAIHGGGMRDMLCPVAQDAPLLTGMVPMYLLMSGFHLGPWLHLISRSAPHNPARPEAENSLVLPHST